MLTPAVKAMKARTAPETVLARAPKPLQQMPWRHAYGISTGPAVAPSPAWDFSKIPVFPPDRESPFQPLPPLVQPKLAIGPVDDPLEREADRIADQMMGTPSPAPSIAGAPLQLSRMCADCAAEDEAPTLQRKPASLSAPAAGYAPGAVSKALGSSGQPLDAAARAYFEPRFGHDFSRVRIHNDTVAHQAATAVNAQAFTVGSKLVFAAGRYAPQTQQGKQLLAHELTHVVQQSGGQWSHLTSTLSAGVIQRQVANQGEEIPAKTKTSTEQDCGTGEVEGHVQICCMPHERQHVKECDDLFSDVLFECWDKGPQDSHHLDVCGGRARFAECRCLASRLGPEHCKCSGLV